MVSKQDDGDLNQDHCSAGRGIWEVESIGLNGWMAGGVREREGSVLRSGGPFKRLHAWSRDGGDDVRSRFWMKMMSFWDGPFN